MVEEIADELRKEFTLKEPAQGKNLDLLEMISRSSNPVSLHVRRGDCKIAATLRAQLPFEYYSNAISVCSEQLGNPIFFVFSDDIPFAKEYLPRDIDAIFVDHNDDFSAHEDMRLMSSCRHHIIANSTFSWWGAWLNPRSDKMVIAPKRWDVTEGSYYPIYYRKAGCWLTLLRGPDKLWLENRSIAELLLRIAAQKIAAEDNK